MSSNLRNILIIVALLILGYALWFFKAIIVYIIASAMISLAGQPLVDLIGKIKIKGKNIPSSIGAAVTLVVFWGLLVVFFRLFVPMISNQLAELSTIESEQVVASMQQPLESINRLFTSLPNSDSGFDLEKTISEKLSSFFSPEFFSGMFSSITSLVGNLFIAAFSITFISFFFLKEEGLFSHAILTITPTKYVEKIKNFLKDVRGLLIRYFLGIGVEVFLVASLITIGLSIVGLHFETAVLIGLFAGMMNVVPYVGPIIGILFGLLISIATNVHLDFMSQLLPLLSYTLLVFIIVQLIDNILFQPLIYSSSVNAHPLEIFLVISIAGSVGGMIGMLVAIPVYTILRVFAKEFFNQFRVVQELTKKIKD